MIGFDAAGRTEALNRAMAVPPSPSQRLPSLVAAIDVIAAPLPLARSLTMVIWPSCVIRPTTAPGVPASELFGTLLGKKVNQRLPSGAKARLVIDLLGVG